MNKPVNLMILTCSAGGGVGGTETFVIELVRHLDKEKFTPLLYCLDYGGDIAGILRREMAALGCRFIAAPYRSGAKLDLRAVSRLRKTLKDEGVELIHSNGGYSTIAGIFSVLGTPVPIIETMHNDILTFSPKTKVFFGLITHRLNKRIAVSGSIAESVPESGFLVPQKKVDMVIHNGVDTGRFSPSPGRAAERKKEGFSGPVIGCVAKLVQRKGHAYLLKAMPRVNQVSPSATLLLLGAGEEEESLKKLSRELGIENNVRFLGCRFDVARWLALCDFLVLPSLSEAEGLPTEGLPLSILEAFAMGKPVIATKVGGVPEVLKDGENGFLVPPCDPERLAERMIYLLSDPERARKMGLSGRALVEREFDIRVTVARYENAYLEAARPAGGKGL